MDLTAGANAPLAGSSVTVAVTGAVDLTALVLSDDGKVGSDADMVFFNNPTAPGARLTGRELHLEPSALRAGATKVVLVASPEDQVSTFGTVGAPVVEVRSGGTTHTLVLGHPSSETALVLCEVYERGGSWKVRAVGQGYSSGLAGVATDFGVDLGDPEPAAAPAPAPINLEKKRMINLEKKLSAENPKMLSLVKTAGISLEKRGLGEHTARVAIALDISGSMSRLYSSGAVAKLVERVLALGLRFDDDGEVDVFLFGLNAHHEQPVGLNNLSTYVDDMLRRHRLEYGTNYGRVLKTVRKHYFGSDDPRRTPQRETTPVYLMFVTDGASQDTRETIEQITSGSYEPLFVQFMAIGPDGSREFEFLERLDDLKGRHVDNADFFSVDQNALMRGSISDNDLFEKLMGEYPGWTRTAKAQGLL